MKYVLLINSILWVASAVYFFYACMLGIVWLDWHRIVNAFIIMAILTCSEIGIGLYTN